MTEEHQSSNLELKNGMGISHKEAKEVNDEMVDKKFEEMAKSVRKLKEMIDKYGYDYSFLEALGIKDYNLNTRLYTLDFDLFKMMYNTHERYLIIKNKKGTDIKMTFNGGNCDEAYTNITSNDDYIANVGIDLAHYKPNYGGADKIPNFDPNLDLPKNRYKKTEFLLDASNSSKLKIIDNISKALQIINEQFKKAEIKMKEINIEKNEKLKLDETSRKQNVNNNLENFF